MSSLIPFKRFSPLHGPRPWAAVFFGETKLEMAVARTGDGKGDVVRQSAVDLPAREETVPLRQQWQTAAQALRAKLDPESHRVITAIGAANVFCLTLRLPATAPAELQQMLDLQIDNLTPLPLEEAVYSFEPLTVADGQTRVLLAIAPKAVLNERVEALEAAGLPPEVITVDVLAVFRSLVQRDLLPRDEKLNALVLLNAQVANVVVHTQGEPLAMCSVRMAADRWDSPDGQTILFQELQRALIAAGVEYGRTEIGQVTFQTWIEDLRPAAVAMAQNWDGRAEFLADGVAPALSLCREMTVGQPPRLNLLPAEWGQRRQKARTRRNLVRAGIVVGALYVLGLILFASLMAERQTRLKRTETKIKQLQPDLAAARQLRGELLEMERQLDVRTSALEVLREASLRLPDNVKLSGFDYKRDPDYKKDQTVTLRGQAQTTTAILDYIKALESAGLFSSVKPVGNMRTLPGGLTTFEVLCIFKTATAGAAAGHGAQ